MSRQRRAEYGAYGVGLPALLVLALLGPGLLPTASAAEEPGTAEPARPPARQPAGRSGLEQRVATLAKALDLDARQRLELRRVLLGQRAQLLKIWSDETVPAADRVGATRALSERTANQIRALLNEEQRKRYNPPPRHEAAGAVGSEQLEDWMTGGKKNLAGRP